MGKYDFDRYDPQKSFSLDDILEEVHQMREEQEASAAEGSANAGSASSLPEELSALPETPREKQLEESIERSIQAHENKQHAPEEFKSEFRPRSKAKEQRHVPSHARAETYYNPITPEEVMRIPIDRPHKPKVPDAAEVPEKQKLPEQPATDASRRETKPLPEPEEIKKPEKPKFIVHIPEENPAAAVDSGRKPSLHHEVVISRGRIVDINDNTEQTKEIESAPHKTEESASDLHPEIRSPLLREVLMEPEADAEQDTKPRSRFHMRFSGSEEDIKEQPAATEEQEQQAEREKSETQGKHASPFSFFHKASVPEESMGDDPALSVNEYTDVSQAGEISSRLAFLRTKEQRKTILCGAAALLLCLLQFLSYLKIDLPAALSPSGSPRTYLILCTVLLLLAFAVCADTVKSGILSLFHGGAPLDSVLSVAFLAAALQQIILIIRPELFFAAGGTLPIYSAVPALLLFLNTAGKWMHASRVEKNFAFLNNGEEKRAILPVEDPMLADALAKPMDIEEAEILTSRKAGFFECFFTLSQTEDTVERNAGVLAPVSVIGSLVVGLGTMFLGRTPYEALTIAVMLLCVCVPAASIFASGFFSSRAAGKSRGENAMLSGGEEAEEVSESDAVLVKAADFFPKDTVLLQGIKLLGEEPIDKVILYAAAVTVKAESPLAEMFMKVLQDKTEYLPPVEYLSYSDNMGLVGKIEGRTILIGNRALMEAHGIIPPAAEMEGKIRRTGRSLAYVAVDNKLAALFAMTYTFHEETEELLHVLDSNGINFIVSTTDANITPEFLEEGFELTEGSVTVPENVTVKQYTDTLSETKPAPAGALFTGGTKDALRLVGRCIRLSGSLRYTAVFQTIAMILAYGLTVFLSLLPGAALISALKILLVQLIVLLIGGIVPGMRRF